MIGNPMEICDPIMVDDDTVQHALARNFRIKRYSAISKIQSYRWMRRHVSIKLPEVGRDIFVDESFIVSLSLRFIPMHPPILKLTTF